VPPDPSLLAIDAAVEEAKQAFREARLAEGEGRRALQQAQGAVLACQQALQAMAREARIRERAPELWERLQDAIAARQRDPDLQNYGEPGKHALAKARHAERLKSIEAEIAEVLTQAGAGVG
jgi:hypothetical protein